MGCLECGSNDSLYRVAYLRLDEPGAWNADICADCLYEFNQTVQGLQVLNSPS